ncbi:dihydroorotate dehydrogenase electron transfer subunit [Armatimonas sp.]|uniref:dihydroorotate dehydrogenase electron transfer subunit n=1 Tax=Armatimonas sp. TaxID=1872638 RepID=UPI0037503E4E
MIRKRAATIVSVQALAAPGHFVLTFDDPETARDARPGHFIAVGATTPANPGSSILRKPFSIFTVDPEAGLCTILFSVYGPTTRTMAHYEPGDTLDFLGPLGGRVFDADPHAPSVHHVMVGGGYGVPPLNFLAKTLKAANPSARVTLIYGARSANLLVGEEGLREAGVEIIACTDDGSLGVKGRVTDGLLSLVGGNIAVYTCGSTPMMRAVAELCIAHCKPCQVSMETPMPCGIGICVGCVLQKADGSFSRTCTDGPVYPAAEVTWQ